MNQGFLIDTDACIGCHACSTACKSENQVPVGVHRTWVKSVEVGLYPDVRRTFQVTRCNHCANPPCVRICPTGAMHQRADGIVDFDGDACIGCKACLQACPYDAIHIDPATQTAAKCHFCAHRVDVGLEPACVVVCPVHAIVAGDLDDPASEIRRRMARSDLTVRRPEQGTAPKLFYASGTDVAMHPTAMESGAMFASSDVAHGHPAAARPVFERQTSTDARGTLVRLPDAQGDPTWGPIHVGGSVAAQIVRVSWNAQHHRPWHWPIPTYLVTKHLSAGAFTVLAATASAGGRPEGFVVAATVALALLWVTLGLLVYDLDRPDRFLYLLTRPQWRSWVARAAWLLTGFAALAHLWWGVECAASWGLVGTELAQSLRVPLALAVLPFAAVSAVYSAFLFGQAEGRDYWQSAHLAPLMAAQAVAAGALVVGCAAPGRALVGVAAVGLAACLALQLGGDLGTSMPSETARLATRKMTAGPYRGAYAASVLGQGMALGLLATGAPVATALCAATLGWLGWAWAVVMAPQDIPNS